MKDELVNFNTAKLAKEKGFNLLTPQFYPTENPHSYHKDLNGVGILGLLHSNSLYEPQNDVDEETGISLYKLTPGIVYAPTQSLLQKWLREIHKINIIVIPDNKNEYLVWDSKFQYTDRTINNYFPEYWAAIGVDTYEEALEVGLYKALELIK